MIDRVLQISGNESYEIASFEVTLEGTIIAPIDEDWLLHDIETKRLATKLDPTSFTIILSEIRNESRIKQIIESDKFDRKFLSAIIQFSFNEMIRRFKHDCFQHNPHMNYMRIPPILKSTISSLFRDVGAAGSQFDRTLTSASILTCLLNWIERLELAALIYIDAQFVEKFIAMNFLRTENCETIIQFAIGCMRIMQERLSKTNRNEILILCKFIATALRMRQIESSIQENIDKYVELEDLLVAVTYDSIKTFIATEHYLNSFQLNQIIDKQCRSKREDDDLELKYAKAIFIAKFVEENYSKENLSNAIDSVDAIQFKDTLLSLSISILRIDYLYFFAITPFEVITSFDWNLSQTKRSKPMRLPMMPIDYLNEAEIIDKFVRRICIFGFPSRQMFEELFMSLLLLINKETEFELVGKLSQ